MTLSNLSNFRTETVLVDEDDEDSLRLHKGISGTPRSRTIDASTVRTSIPEFASTSVPKVVKNFSQLERLVTAPLPPDFHASTS